MKKTESKVLKKFQKNVDKNIRSMSSDLELKKKSIDWMLHADKYKYTYNYRWMGIPIIKFPTDIVALQEIIWKVKPDIIIETGIAHGGSLLFSATMMELIGNQGKVIGVDIDIRKHNRIEIEKSKFNNNIVMLEGSSVSQKIIKKIKSFIKQGNKVMVFLDSNHTYSHVKKEIEIYSKLVTKNSSWWKQIKYRPGHGRALYRPLHKLRRSHDLDIRRRARERKPRGTPARRPG